MQLSKNSKEAMDFLWLKVTSKPLPQLSDEALQGQSL